MKKIAFIAALVAAVGSANAALVNYGASLEPYFQTQPTVGTTALTSGSIGFELDTVTGAIRGSITGLDLTGAATGFHIHQAAAGVNGPIIVDLASLPRFFQSTTVVGGRTYEVVGFNGNVNNALENGATLASVVAALDGMNAYANLHTALNPAGEIRGQLCQTVPEPATMAALGLGALGLLRRRRTGR